MKASEILAKARQILQERGWTQYVYKKKGDGFCAFGALYSALGAPDKDIEEDRIGPGCMDIPISFAAAETALRDVHRIAILDYNDARGRTFDQVVDWFERAESIAIKREKTAE